MALGDSPHLRSRAKARFRRSEEFAQEAAAVFGQHAGLIRERLPDAEIRHRGGTSVHGVLTSGDVDVHVRVERQAFDAAFAQLAALYQPFHRDGWSPGESAFFFAPDSQPPVEVALTVIGSRDDLHHGEAWDRIAADPSLLDRYNELKRRSIDATRAEYEAAKRAFFYENF